MLLTVFTPTYNRANILWRTFESLGKQNFKDFEWLVIDDGSTDDTEEVVRQFIREADFPIKYVKQDHGGKHRAYNRALVIARGEYLFTVDSDDWLTDGSLENSALYLLTLRPNDAMCGIIALKEDANGDLFGVRFPASPMTADLYSLEDMKCNGERSFVLNTRIARQYPFPVIDNEIFVTENVIYDRIGRNWQFLAVNCSLTVCEYQRDGLTKSIYNLMWNNPVGFMIYHYQRINFATNILTAARHALRYLAFRTIAKDTKTY